MSRTLLVKYAFLLRRETDVGRETSFYDFVPYRFGPFSFALYRELASLEKRGYIEWEENGVRLSASRESEMTNALRRVPDTGRAAIEHIIQRYGLANTDDLLRDIYRRYPWYAVKSERRDLISERPPLPEGAGGRIFTVGYEGKSVDAFFNQLLAEGVEVLIDVRANPISRKYGFARTSMREIAGKLDIEYRHFPELGIPARLRADLSDYESYRKLFERYETTVLARRVTELEGIGELAHRFSVALVCMEADPRYCHRARVAEALRRKGGFEITHLGQAA